MTLKVKDGGVWKDASPYVKHNGVWKNPDEIFVKHGGVWKSAWTNKKTVSYTATFAEGSKGKWEITFVNLAAGTALPAFLTAGPVKSNHTFQIYANQGDTAQSGAAYAGAVQIYEKNSSNQLNSNFAGEHPFIDQLTEIELFNVTTGKVLETWVASDRKGSVGTTNTVGHYFYPNNIANPVQAWENPAAGGDVGRLTFRGNW